MGGYEPVIIERDGTHFCFRQGGEMLFRVPGAIVDAYTPDAVFFPDWSSPRATTNDPEPRYLLWNPETSELLMGAIQQRPPLLAESFGTRPFRAYLQVYWLPAYKRLVLRTYWNPASSGKTFDREDRLTSLSVQLRFLSLISRLRPPAGWTATLNAIERYQRESGLDGSGDWDEDSSLPKVWLAPPLPLSTATGTELLETLSAELAGKAFATVDERRIISIETFDEQTMAAVKVMLKRLHLDHEESAYTSH